MVDIVKQRLLGLFELLADPPNTPFAHNLRAFRFLVLVHVSVHSWIYVIEPFTAAHLAFPYPGSIIVSVACTMCCLLALTRHGRLAPILVLPPLICRLYWSGLWIPNHTFLVFVCVLLLATLDPDSDDEGELLLQSLRWIAIVVFFYTGLQKLLHGFWFRGEFLAWMVSHGNDNWRWAFSWILPAEEIVRLRSLDYAMDSGPYRVASVPFILLSNLTYLAEMVLPVLILWRRTRIPATLFTIGFALTIQLAPREFKFFLCFSNLLLLFIPGNWNHRLAPIFVFFYLCLLASKLELFGDLFIKAG